MIALLIVNAVSLFWLIRALKALKKMEEDQDD